MAEKCARFRRVSSGGQDEDNQLPEIDGHIAERGYEVAGDFALHAKSASKGEQEQALEQILADIRAGVYTVLVIAHSSRIDRRDPDVAMLWLLLVKMAGGRIESVREPEFGRSTLSGRLMTLLAQEGNHKYSKDLRENIAAARVRIAANGAHDGRYPWGFTSQGEKYNKRLVPTDEAREYVPQVFARIIAGESLAKVAAWLNECGVKATGIKNKENTKGKSGKWWAETVSLMIRNPIYMGKHTSALGEVIHKVEPLVDAAVWKRAGERLDSKPRRGPRWPDGWLSGIARCERCDGPLYRIDTGPKGRRITYLRCSGTGPLRKGCGAPLIRWDVAEPLSNDVLGALTIPEYERALISVGNSAELDARAAEIEFERKRLSARGLSWDAEDAERARLRGEYDAVMATERTQDVYGLTATGKTYGDTWNAMDAPQRAAWLESGEMVITFAKGGPYREPAGELDGVNMFVHWTGDGLTGNEVGADHAYWAEREACGAALHVAAKEQDQ